MSTAPAVDAREAANRAPVQIESVLTECFMEAFLRVIQARRSRTYQAIGGPRNVGATTGATAMPTAVCTAPACRVRNTNLQGGGWLFHLHRPLIHRCHADGTRTPRTAQ